MLYSKQIKLNTFILLTAVAVGLVYPFLAIGATLKVPGDYATIQEALTAASSGDEIWVVKGTYKPDQGVGVTPGDRTAAFQLKNGVAIYGGFAGGETSRDQRDWQTNETILSGDIGTISIETDNSYHVVTGSGTVPTAILDGFIITAGNADASIWPDNQGGGMLNDSGSPTVTNCTFSGNSAIDFGGGVYIKGGAPRLSNNIVSGNSAGIEGGGIYLDNSCYILVNNTITSNTSGGIYAVLSLLDCYREITNCILWGNNDYDMKDEGSELITYSDIGNWITPISHPIGNISADPMFVNPIAGDYHLMAGSPCIDVGRNMMFALPETDFDGNPRVVDGDGDGTDTVDMGAFETIVGSTPPGENIPVQPQDPVTGETPVTLTFDDVTDGGVTAVISTTPSDEQGAPEGFKFGNPPVIYEISTTATFTGPIEVCFDYSGANYGNEANLKLFHREGSSWVDITNPDDPPDNPNPNTINQIICGTVTSFSFFGVFESEFVDPVVLLGELAGKVFGLNLQNGISNSLDAKLNAALQALDDINANNDVAAINTLEAFINAVQAQRGSKIPETDADALINDAQEIIAAMSSS